MTKIEKVWHHLQVKGWIDSKTIQRLTNTTCARDYIYELNRSKRCRTIPHRITSSYTRWIRVSRSPY